MKQVQITCDRCGLSIEPLDSAYNAQRAAGGGSLVVLERTNGGMGHNQVPLNGWHFHYLCFCDVVTAIRSTFRAPTTKAEG